MFTATETGPVDALLRVGVQLDVDDFCLNDHLALNIDLHGAQHAFNHAQLFGHAAHQHRAAHLVDRHGAAFSAAVHTAQPLAQLRVAVVRNISARGIAAAAAAATRFGLLFGNLAAQHGAQGVFQLTPDI